MAYIRRKAPSLALSPRIGDAQHCSSRAQGGELGASRLERGHSLRPEEVHTARSSADAFGFGPSFAESSGRDSHHRWARGRLVPHVGRGRRHTGECRQFSYQRVESSTRQRCVRVTCSGIRARWSGRPSPRPLSWLILPARRGVAGIPAGQRGWPSWGVRRNSLQGVSADFQSP
jgi:hypothetical protein